MYLCCNCVYICVMCVPIHVCIYNLLYLPSKRNQRSLEPGRRRVAHEPRTSHCPRNKAEPEAKGLHGKRTQMPISRTSDWLHLRSFEHQKEYW